MCGTIYLIEDITTYAKIDAVLTSMLIRPVSILPVFLTNRFQYLLSGNVCRYQKEQLLNTFAQNPGRVRLLAAFDLCLVQTSHEASKSVITSKEPSTFAPSRHIIINLRKKS